MKISGFFPLGKVLIAAVAICGLSSSAKADLELTLGSAAPIDLTTKGLSGFADVNGITVAYTVNESYSNGVESMTLGIVAINTTTTTAGFTYNLTDTSVSNTSVATTINNTLTGGVIGVGSVVGDTATYMNTTTGAFGTAGPLTLGSATTASGSISGYGSGPYSLSLTGMVSGVTSGSSVAFSSKAQVIGVPEPTGVIAALAGLPCMGLVVGFARRRRAAEAVAM
jgi:hypothetical protein